MALAGIFLFLGLQILGWLLFSYLMDAFLSHKHQCHHKWLQEFKEGLNSDPEKEQWQLFCQECKEYV